MGQSFNRARSEVLTAANAFNEYNIAPELSAKLSASDYLEGTLRRCITSHKTHAAPTESIRKYFEDLQSVSIANGGSILTTTGWDVLDEFNYLLDRWCGVCGAGEVDMLNITKDLMRISTRMDAVMVGHFDKLDASKPLPDKKVIDGFYMSTWNDETVHVIKTYIQMMKCVLSARVRYLYVPYTRLYRIGTTYVSCTTVLPLTAPLCAANQSVIIPAVGRLLLNALQGVFEGGTLCDAAVAGTELKRIFMGTDARFYLMDVVPTTLLAHADGVKSCVILNLFPSNIVTGLAQGVARYFIACKTTQENFFSHSLWLQEVRCAFPFRVRWLYHLLPHVDPAKYPEHRTAVITEILARAVKKCIVGEWFEAKAVSRSMCVNLANRFFRSVLGEDNEVAVTKYVMPVLVRCFGVPNDKLQSTFSLQSPIVVAQVLARCRELLGLYETNTATDQVHVVPAGRTQPPSLLSGPLSQRGTFLSLLTNNAGADFTERQTAFVMLRGQETMKAGLATFTKQVETYKADPG
eukprot:PhF_6_TR42669/c0_g2_i1/m.64325